MSRYIGISLNDDFTELCVGEESQQKTFPTIVCKKKNSDTWLVGEAAYKATLDGSGVLVDKLLSLLRKKGTATIERVCYSGEELMEHYLRAILTDEWTKASEKLSEIKIEEPKEEPKEEMPEAEKTPEEKEEERGEKPRRLLEILPVGMLSEMKEEAAPEYAEQSIPEEVPEEEVHDGRLIVLSLRKAEREIFESLEEILNRIKEEEDQVQLISHTESFVHYILHQDKNLYNRLVGMFELSNQCLYYYEMQVSRGSRRYVIADSEAQEEAFNLDIIKTPSGAKIADRILNSLAERNLNKKSFSSVFLSGRGFETTDFAPNFMTTICRGRRGCIEPRIFAIGAMHYAKQIGTGENEEYTILCDTRVSCDISVKVIQKEREQRLPIIHAGDSWIRQDMKCEMILDRQNFVDFQLTPMIGGQRPAQLRMLLTGFPERENRTTRIQLRADFVDAGHLKITVKDLGFGELFPATDAFVTEEIDLRKTLEEA